MIERLRTAAALAVLCALGVSTAWSDPAYSYGSTGTTGDDYYLSTDSANPTTVFSGLTIRDMLTKYKISGYIGGGWIENGEVGGVYNARVAKDAVTVQFQKQEGATIKGVVVKFQQSGDAITAYAVNFAYRTYSSESEAILGVDFVTDKTGAATPATSDSANGYGIYGITLTSLGVEGVPVNIAVCKPLAVWNGDFPSTTTGTNKRGDYTLSVNGNTPGASGEYIQITSSSGGVSVLSDFRINPISAVSSFYNMPSSGSRVLTTGYRNDSNKNSIWAGLCDSTSFIRVWTSGGGAAASSESTTWDFASPGAHYFGFSYNHDNSYENRGTACFYDGNGMAYASGQVWSGEALYGFCFGGQNANGNYKATNAKLSYVAILNSSAPVDISTWSLTGMTSAATLANEATISGDTYASTGLNLNLNGGSVTVTSAATAAALFVQSDTTLAFTGDATLTVGADGLGPIYIAEGATLTIDATGRNATSVATYLLAGIPYGKSQIVVKTPAAFAAAADDYGVQICKYWKWNYANAIVTWTTPSDGASDMGGASTYALFDRSTGVNTDTTYTGNQNGIVNDKFWNNFAYKAANVTTYYSAPGLALRVAGDSCQKNIGGTFGPFALGGLVVEDGAEGYRFVQTDQDYRSTILGDPSGTRETWFVFEESFAFNRGKSSRTSECAFSGSINFEIEGEGVEVAFSGGCSAPTIYGEIERNASGSYIGAGTTGGILKMHGEGKMTLTSLNASGATLDYSDLAANRSTAFINAALTVNSSTTFKFPTNAVFPYPVAASVTGASSGDMTYYIGETEYTGKITFTSGYACPATSATFAGGGSGTWDTLAWDKNYNGAISMGGECTVNIEDSGTIAMGASPVSASKVTFNIPSGKSLTLTGQVYAYEINFTGGTVVCSANNTLNGTVKGNAEILYPEGVLPSSGTTLTDEGWMGTLVITNCGHLKVGGTDRVPFESLGSVNSKIKAPGFKGYAAVLNQNTICQAELIIDESTTFEFNHGWLDEQWAESETQGFYTEAQNAGFKFRKLSGSGKLRLDGDTDFAQYIFCDVSGFTGDVDITYPEGGGRKSYLFGVPDSWEIVGSAYPANLVVASNMTVAASKKWDIPAGIILRDDATLGLSDGSIITALSPKSDGGLSIPSGTATLSNVLSSVVTTTLNIGSGANFKISDTALKSITIPADASVPGATYVNGGVLDLRGCTALETLHLTLGESKGFADLGTEKLLLPATCTNFVYDIGAKRDLTGYSLPAVDPGTNTYYYATETIDEYASGGFTVSNVTGEAVVWLIRQNGALIKTAASGTDRTYVGGRSFAGAACWHEWDFEQTDAANKLNDSGACTTNNSVVATNNLNIIGASATYQPITVSGQESKTALPSYLLPYPSETLTFPTDTTGWSMALRCSMPTGEDKQVAIAFGDTDNGILGLASAPGGFVEMFNWVNGTYTTLAQLKVEVPVGPQYDNMHLFVFTVTNDTSVTPAKNYVTLYRDGEFIHTAEFALKENGTIRQFKVGDVCGTRPNQNDTLPAAIAEANTGYVDYVRLYDRVIPESDVTGLSLRRPFVSAIETYEREIATLAAQWSATDAWAMKIAGTTANEPAADKNVSLTANGGTAINLNLGSNVKYDTLIFSGSGENSLLQTASGKIGAQMFVVRRGMDLTVDYDAVNLSDAVVGVDQGAKLTFDFTEFPFDSVTEATDIVLVGSVPAKAYDRTCVDRYEVVWPETLPAHIKSAEAVWDVVSYKVTITPDHIAGSDVFYVGGYWSRNENSFAVTNSSGDATSVFPGDTVVIPAYIDGGNASTAYFDSLLPANVTKIRVEKDYTFESGVNNAAVLGGVTVTVASGSVLSFGATWHTLSLGETTFDGPGSVYFDVDASAARIAGTAPIAIAAGKTLTLGSVATFVSGGVGGFGVVKLPDISGEVNLNTYGASGSTVALKGLTNGSLTGNAVTPTVRLDGDVTVSTYVDSTAYSFAKIIGSGDLTFGSTGSPSAITISEIEDYTGSLNNNASVGVTVGRISLPMDVNGGTLLLATNGVGSVAVSSVYVDGVASEMTTVWAPGGLYKASAKIADTPYATFADAIAAATDDNLGSITVLDAKASLPNGYVILNGTTVDKRTASSVTFNYYASYATARVSAVVNGDGEYTLHVGDRDYQSESHDGTVVFVDVDVSASALGEVTAYTITYGGSQIGSGTSSAKGNVVNGSTWMKWSTETASNVGIWSPSSPTYSEGVAAFSGTNTYTAAWMSTGEVVTVTTNVKFGDVADPDITPDTDAQAAVRLFDVDGVTFQVWDGNDWVNVSNDTLGTPSGDATYQVEVKLNYSTQKYGVKIGEYQLALTGSDPAVTLFPLAKAASAMQKVSYLGAGSFISLSGEYVSAGYTADVGTDGSATNVVVSSDFVNTYMGGVLAKDVSDALNPNATDPGVNPEAFAPNGNGLSYFASYALGLDPTDPEDKPEVRVETVDGQFVVTLVDGDGNPIEGAANVALSVKLNYGSTTAVTGGSTAPVAPGESITLTPDLLPFGENNNVLYYKAEVMIGAK